MRRVCAFVLFLSCFLSVSCSMGGPDALVADCADAALEVKDAVLYTGGVVFGSVVIPAAVYIDSEDASPGNSKKAMVHLVWIEPDDTVNDFAGINVSYSSLDTINNTPYQRIINNRYGKGENPAKNGHSHAYLFEKGYPEAYDSLISNPGKEQDIPLFASADKEHMVINVTAYDKKMKMSPSSTVVSVIEMVTTNAALGCGYNVADKDKYNDKDCGGQVIDILALKNWNKFSMSHLQLNETVQDHISSDSKDEFIQKSMEKETKNVKMGVATTIFKVAFKLNFEKNFSTKSESNLKTVDKTFYSQYTAQVVRSNQKVLEPYATPDVLKQFLVPAFRNDINNPSFKPQQIFDKYGTHVLLDVNLGGRLEIRMNGEYSSRKTDASSETISKSVIVAVTNESSSSSSSVLNNETQDVKVTLEAIGGSKIPYAYWTGNDVTGDITTWSASIKDDAETCLLIDSPTCLDNEDWSTGIWLYADDPARRNEIREAYLEKLYGNYASLVSETFRTKDDGLYVKSFGFVSISNPDYPNSRIDGDEKVVSDDGYIYVNENGEIGDFSLDILKEKALEREKLNGNAGVSADNIVFFRRPGSSFLFKIVDAKRNIYSNPYDSSEKNKYSVRLGSLRYENSPERPFVSPYDLQGGYVFYYPYKILTTNPDEALYGILSDTVDFKKYEIKKVSEVEDKDRFFKDNGLEDFCESFSDPDTYVKSQKNLAYNSWKTASDNVFNTLRNGDGRYSDSGSGDLLENPFDRGTFNANVSYIPSNASDDRSSVSRSFPLKDTAFFGNYKDLTWLTDSGFKDRLEYYLGLDFDALANPGSINVTSYNTNVEQHHYYNTHDYVTTYIPFRRSVSVDHETDTSISILIGNQKKRYSIETWSDDYYYALNYCDGRLFNSNYPDSFPYSGDSRMTPSVVYTSNMMDEKGNSRNSERAKPIKDIDFILCRNNYVNPLAPEESLAYTGTYKWEIVDFPVGAGEWKMLGTWSTEKNVDVAKRDGVISSMYDDISSNNTSYSYGSSYNYFTRFSGVPENIDLNNDKYPRYKYGWSSKSWTKWDNTWFGTDDDAKNKTFHHSRGYNYYGNRKMDGAMSVPVEIRDMDRYDIYIRYRR